MPLASVDNPRPHHSGLESVATAAVETFRRDIVPAVPGTAGDAASRAEKHFVVSGRREAPLRPTRSSALESILGDIDRRKPILETELSPWRMICALEIVSQSGLPYVGTGWFVGPHTLVTAGHCVYDPVELGGWARSITVTPGRNGDDQPFANVDSSRFSTTDRWLNEQNPDFDYAAIHLDSDLGATVGSFGIGVLPDDELKNLLVNVSGYPVEPGGGRSQYFHANRVKALTGRRLFYDIDTIGGQSGSPVWAYVDGDQNPIAVAIHAYGVGGTPADLNVHANSGPRIVPEVLEVIRGWIAA